jgi:hypothetical protein
MERVCRTRRHKSEPRNNTSMQMQSHAARAKVGCCHTFSVVIVFCVVFAILVALSPSAADEAGPSAAPTDTSPPIAVEPAAMDDDALSYVESVIADGFPEVPPLPAEYAHYQPEIDAALARFNELRTNAAAWKHAKSSNGVECYKLVAGSLPCARGDGIIPFPIRSVLHT